MVISRAEMLASQRTPDTTGKELSSVGGFHSRWSRRFGDQHSCKVENKLYTKSPFKLCKNLLFLAMRAQPTHSIATANRMAWKNIKSLYAMLQENVTNHTQCYRRICVTNHASDRGGVSCSPTEARIQLEVVILGIISWSISYIMAIVSYEIPPLLDCMGFHGPPGSKSRSWRGRGRWGTPDSNRLLYFQDLAEVQTWFTPLRKVTRTSSSLPDTVWHLSMVV